MSCIITYKGQKYSEEQFKEYFINNKQEFATSIAKNKDVIDSFKRKMEGIDYVFSQSPEIASIGSKAQYLQYLSTIFKTSKVKDIVYHFSKDKFKKDFRNTKSALSKESDNSIHFGNLEQAQDREQNIERQLFESKWDSTGKKTVYDYSKEIYNKEFKELTIDEQAEIIYLEQVDKENVLLDNLAKIKEGKIYPVLLNSRVISIQKDKGLNKFDYSQGDTIKYLNEVEAFWNKSYSYAVKNPEQIHILSSKKDLEMFRNFINFTKSEYAKYGDIQQFKDYIMSKNFAAIEEFLVVNNKIDRKC